MIKTMDDIQSIALSVLKRMAQHKYENEQVEIWMHLFVTALALASQADEVVEWEEREVFMDLCRWLVRAKSNLPYKFNKTMLNTLMEAFNDPKTLEAIQKETKQLVAKGAWSSKNEADAFQEFLFRSYHEAMFRLMFADGIFETTERAYLENALEQFQLPRTLVSEWEQKYSNIL